MQNKYKLLFELHDIDQSIVHVRQKTQEIPLLIAEKQNILKKLTDQLSSARQMLKQQKVDQSLKEVELKEVEGKIQDLESKRWNLKTNKELTVLQHEISFLEEKKDNIQNEIIHFLLSEEEGQANIKSLEYKQNQEGKIIEQEVKVLGKELESYIKELEELTEKREKISLQLDGNTRSRYFVILNSRKGIATSILDVHTCSQCGIRVRPQIINEVRSRKDICFCEGCNRILLYREQENSDNI